MGFIRNRKIFIISLIAVFAAIILWLSVSGIFYFNKASGVILNEVCSKNVSCYIDKDGRTPDWVEIKNTSDAEIDLKDYSISRGTVEKQYRLPEIKIPAGAICVISLPFGIDEGNDVCLAEKSGTIIDNVPVPGIKYDTSISRFDDGKWRRTLPTPEGENSDLEISYPELKTPSFSTESGFYDEPFYLSLSAENGEKIYYTLDGSEPDEGSYLYTDPILIEDASANPNIYSSIKDISIGYTSPLKYSLPDYNVDKALIVKAKAYDDKGGFSDTGSRSFFVGFNDKKEYADTPVISLTFDPDDFFSDSRGIYVLGDRYKAYIDNNEKESYDKKDIWWWTPGNYSYRGRESERKVHVSYFDENKSLVFDSDTGARIKGGGSRGFAQKSLKLTARSAYGKDAFDGLGLGGLKKEKSIVLSSGGDDINTKLKDPLAAILASDREISVLDSKPCFVFLNGEYWGICRLSEEFGRDYIARHYGVNSENIVMIKNDRVKVGSPEDKELYDSLNSFINNTDFTKDREFETLCEMVDMDSLIDYFAVQIYIEHTNDWPGSNFALWRTKEKEAGAYGDCRWRWMLFDVNSVSMEKEKYDADTMSEILEKNYIMKALIQSPIFRKRFAERIAELKEKDFAAERTDKEIDRLTAEMSSGMKGFYRRFYGDRISPDHFITEAEGLKNFFRMRGDYITEYVNKACSN
ncbi:MAG: CotH kinase family protein [Lachnospiraceae bacterium]|nr:CotH kinase family protein [Lachnospiraceae bacterium]